MFTVYLRNDIIRHYDDDLKLFLVAALKRIDYLADCSDDILVQLAYNCVPEIKEEGAILMDMNANIENQITDELVIIFDGGVELFMTMDASTDLTIERLPTGSIINAHNMLADRKNNINARFTTNTSFYFLKYAKLVEVAQNYP